MRLWASGETVKVWAGNQGEVEAPGQLLGCRHVPLLVAAFLIFL